MIPTETMGGESASMDSLIDAAGDQTLSQLSASDTQTESAVPHDAEAEPAEEAAAEAAPAEVAEPVAEEAPKLEEEDEFAEDDLSNPDRVSRDGKLHYYKPQRIAKFVESHKAMQSIRAAIPGATVESVKEMYGTTAALEQMYADYDNGDVDKFANHWREENPNSFAKLMLDAPKHLTAINPQLATRLERQYDLGVVRRLYREFQTKGDEKYLALAQHMDRVMTGKYKSAADLAKHDPVAEEREQLQNERRAFEEQRNAEHRQQAESWVKETNNAVSSTTIGLIDKALARPELKVFDGQRQMDWMRGDLNKAIDQAMKDNPTWSRQHEALRKQAQARPSEESRKALVTHKEQFDRQVIARNLPAIIKAATGKFLGQSAATHSKMAASATRTEPANAGSPVNGVGVNKRLNDAKSMDDVWKAVGW